MNEDEIKLGMNKLAFEMTKYILEKGTINLTNTNSRIEGRDKLVVTIMNECYQSIINNIVNIKAEDKV